METGFLLTAFAAVILGGILKGMSGFGYAVISTTLLATFYPAPQAVAFMIIPLMAINTQLLTEMKRKEIKTCLNNFKPYIASLMIGTIIGFYAVTVIPANSVKLFLGVLTFLFAVSKTGRLNTSIGKFKKKCFRRSNKTQFLLGMLSGVIFGGTNIGVQIITCLKTMNLNRKKFIGLTALIMIPISALRLPLTVNSGVLENILIWSVLAAPLGMVAAWTGNQTAEKLNQNQIKNITIMLLVIISINLIRTSTLPYL